MIFNLISKLIFSFIIGSLLGLSIYSQKVSDQTNILQPPSKELIALHHPDLTGLEKEIREQIEIWQKSLAKQAQTTPQNRENLSRAYGTMGEIYHIYSFFEPARESYLNASRLDPENYRWFYFLGKLGMGQNKYYDAIDYFNKTKKLNPNYLPIYINLANSYLELDLLSVAEENFKFALKYSKNNPAALYGLGQIEYSKRNFAESVKYFEQVLQILPEANRVHYSLAISYRGLKNIEKARFHLARQGTVGVRVGDPLFESLNDLKKGIRLNLLRGKQAFEAKRYAAAETEFLKVLEKEPNNITAIVNLGTTYVQLGSGTKAVSQFEKAIELQPDNTNARYNLAILLALQNKHYQAIAQLKEVLKTNPKDIDARFLLAKELSNANLLKESLSEFAIVLSSNEDNENVFLEVIQLLTKLGDYAQAKTLLEKSLAKFPERVRTTATLAFLLTTAPDKKMRDGQKAFELANKAYATTKLIQHGAIVTMALAELGRCSEAANKTKQLIKEAEKLKNTDLVNKLNTELKRFEDEKTCQNKQ
jgi:tetratricopeptide (TPR) repeat protein